MIKGSIDFSERNDAGKTDKLIKERWSPRAFKKETIPQNDLELIFNATRFAPSAYNEQPWLIKTASRDSQNFKKYLDLLLPQNQEWAKNASLIGFFFKEKRFSHNDKKNLWAAFDNGAAWMTMTFQSRILGYYTHAMAGIKRESLCSELAVSEDDYKPIVGFVIGILADADILSDKFREYEKPSSRKNLEKIWISE